MLITTTNELRLYSPANAIDAIETLTGFIDSSEHDFLEEKLGKDLFVLLQKYYRGIGEAGIMTLIESIQRNETLLPYSQLLMLAQRCVCFDALGRAIDMQAISVNGSGVNVATSDDYGKADKDAISAYKQTCYKESHSAVNRLLIVLEEWMREVASVTGEGKDTDEYREKKEITDAWQKSRYFFLVGSLLIPSAQVLQEYVNIYDNREKYITLLPDLRYIQEDILAPVVGEELLDFLTDNAIKGTKDKKLARLIHRLRKAMVKHLIARTNFLKLSAPDLATVHNEAVLMVNNCVDYIRMYQSDFLSLAKDAMEASPIYDASENKVREPYESTFKNNEDGNVMFVIPALS
nr:MAG TPA: hypothetical protein [Caudoviricetes sp.]